MHKGTRTDKALRGRRAESREPGASDRTDGGAPQSGGSWGASSTLDTARMRGGVSGVPGGGRAAWDPLPLGAVFGALRERDVRSLAGPVLDLIAPEGTEVVREGEQIGIFFVIRSGSASVVSGGVPVASLGAGDCFGEPDPYASATQRYTIVASTRLRLVGFSSVGIERLCAEIPGARERILGLLPARSAGAAGALPQRGGVKHRDRPVVGRDPAELAHQTQRAGDRLARGSRPARELVLRQG
jgi:CRP-like cAMP-binding protein